MFTKPKAEEAEIPNTEVGSIVVQNNIPNIVNFDKAVFDQLVDMHGGEINPWDLPSIKMPGIGGTKFKLMDDEVQRFNAVILHMQAHRRLYRESYDGKSEMQPDCICDDASPLNGEPIGYGNPDGTEDGDGEHQCNECKYNEWGSVTLLTGKPGKAKACSTRRMLILAVEGMALPHIFDLPTTSVSVLRKFCTSQLNRGRSIHNILVQFSLKENGKLHIEYVADNSTPPEVLKLAAETAPRSKKPDW